MDRKFLKRERMEILELIINNEDLETIANCLRLNVTANDFAISPITNHLCDYAVTFQTAVQEELPGAVDSRKLVPPRCVL